MHGVTGGLFYSVGELFVTVTIIFAYENIALNKPAWQQYPYTNPDWGADKAVDGRFTDRRAVGGQCTICADGFYTATWWVDLRRVLSIHHINIFYRTDNVVFGIV
ncbi:uncharacterized protein LOC134238654 [Saccostrea cucullata]|uniref:uncharacterized protein LOC134238654 n=1 Tax=Saccostrea cuccullata TaxID=36930 RepID=UPI002ED658BB